MMQEKKQTAMMVLLDKWHRMPPRCKNYGNDRKNVK